MESEKMLIEARAVTPGNPTTTRAITENPTAEEQNTTWPRDNLGTEQGAISQPEFPDGASARLEISYVSVAETLRGELSSLPFSLVVRPVTSPGGQRSPVLPAPCAPGLRCVWSGE